MSRLAVAAAMAMATLVSVHASGTTEGAYWTRVNGRRVYYEVHGHGRPLLLLHGGDSGGHSFARQMASFARHHEIIVPDQVGQGRTPDVPGPLTYTGMMQDTVELLHKLNIQEADVVGFSDGGILALMLAVHHPELTRRLAISGVNFAPDGLTSDTLDELRAAMPEGKPKTIDEKLEQLWLNSPTEKELNLKLLASIEDPVLVMSGDRDVITLEHTITIYRTIPNAELFVLPGTDHGTFDTRPGLVNPVVLNFLDGPGSR